MAQNKNILLILLLANAVKKFLFYLIKSTYQIPQVKNKFTECNSK